jgi:hypothetical protein
MMDYDPSTLKISPFRYMKFTVPAMYMNSPEVLERSLLKRPGASIIHILSHEQRPGFHLVVNEDGSQYTDDFGLEVYIAKDIDWTGDLRDIDEREQDVHQLPF